MKTRIMNKEPKKEYDMELEVLRLTQRKEYFKALMMISNMIEGFLRRFYNEKDRIKKDKLLVNDVIKNNKKPLSQIANWANKEKIIENEDLIKIFDLIDVRNDIAHNYYLNFDENINKEYADIVINSNLPILSKLIKSYIEFTKVTKSNNNNS